MKYKITLFIILLISCLCLTSCSKDEDEPVDIDQQIENAFQKISENKTLALLIGEKKSVNLDLNLQIEILWLCSNSNIVSISGEGKSVELNALSIGDAEMTVYIGEQSQKYQITVRNLDFPKLVMAFEDATIFTGTTLNIQAEVWISGQKAATQPVIEYVSSNTGIAIVNNTGVIEAQAAGSAVITVSCSYNGIILSEQISINVNEI